MKRLGGGRRRTMIVGAITASSLLAVVAAPLAAGGGRPGVAEARAATAKFHSLAVAEGAGYGKFYECTDAEGIGAMGQHFVNGGLVGDAQLDVRTPEVLVYEPRANGGWRLVGVEYVEIAAVWDAAHASPPQLFGQTLRRVAAPNRYGLPDFYEIHAWIWQPNPRGMFDDWNPAVTCRGMGDAA